MGQNQEQTGGPDVVEAALAAALEKATAAGDLEAVKMLVDELRARREARHRVVKLDVERVKRSR